MTEFERLALLLGCKATLILGLVAALYLLVGRRWPQSCTTWLRFGVIALCALPVAVWAVPTIGIPVLSAPRQALSARGEAPIRLNAPAHQREKLPAATSSLPATGATETGGPGWSPVKIVGLCLAAYSLVVVVLAIRFVAACRGLDQLRRSSMPVGDPSWQATLAHWCGMLQVRRPVELRATDKVSVPMTFGWRVPVILVPIDCVTPCDETASDKVQREAIIVHELTHIARSDFFWQALTQLTASMYWVHPLVWLIRRQDGALRERICDAFCSQHLSREAYAQALVQIAGRKYFRPLAALGMAMAHPSSLRRRLNELETGAAAHCSIPNRVQRVFLGGTAALVLGLIVAGTLTTRTSAVGADDKSAGKAAGSAPAAQKAPAKKEVPPVRLPDTLTGQVVDKEDRPVAKADVTLLIRRFNPYVDPADATAPKPWTATTDGQGRYTIATGDTMLGPHDEVRIKIRADGFADSSQADYERRILQGTLPVQKLHAGRKVQGRLVDAGGNPVGPAIIRFHADTPDYSLIWDSGPLSVDKTGAFSATISKAGKAALVIYPRGFAPRIVDVPEDDANLGAIRVESGTSLTGRVVDRKGQGVAGTVVAVRSEEQFRLNVMHLPVATAVKTDEGGRFTLPPMRGLCAVRVTDSAPDYTRQLMETGAKPPPILPERIDFDGIDKTQEIEFSEAVSVTVRGTVRWADGAGVPDVQIQTSLLPASWIMGIELESTRTDAEGRYTLRLPASAERVYVTIHQSIRAPDGINRQAKAVGNGANAQDQNRTIMFESLTEDEADADWEVGAGK